jgi:hypothetical protein
MPGFRWAAHNPVDGSVKTLAQREANHEVGKGPVPGAMYLWQRSRGRIERYSNILWSWPQHLNTPNHSDLALWQRGTATQARARRGCGSWCVGVGACIESRLLAGGSCSLTDPFTPPNLLPHHYHPRPTVPRPPLHAALATPLAGMERFWSGGGLSCGASILLSIQRYCWNGQNSFGRCE